jgi:hypothetical protein
LRVKDAALGAALGKAQILPSAPKPDRAPGADYLLPNYDEYLIAYRDRDAVIDGDRSRTLALALAIAREYPHQVILNGQVAGGWRRRMTDAAAAVVVKPYKPLGKPQLRALAGQAEACGRFFGRPCRLEV